MNQYDLWEGPYAKVGHNGIFVRIDDRPLPDEVGRAFASCEKRLYSAEDEDGNRLKDYSIFLCRGFSGEEMDRAPETH